MIRGGIRMEKGRVKVRLEDLPKNYRGHRCVILMRLLFPDEFPPGKLFFDEAVYTWNVEPDDLRVCAWLGDSFRECGEAHSLQEALKLVYQDLADLLNFLPEQPIRVVE